MIGRDEQLAAEREAWDDERGAEQYERELFELDDREDYER